MGLGLSVDGQTYFSEFVSTEKKPPWMDFGRVIGQLSGDYRILNFVSGFEGMQKFYFRTPKWPIGGMYFDGILRTEHVSRVRTTQYPVQTGVTMTDHAIFEPAEVTIDVVMTNTATANLTGDAIGSFVGFAAGQFLGTTAGGIVGTAYNMYQNLQKLDYSNAKDLNCKPSAIAQVGEERSVNAWQALKTMQLSRVPIVVETRLQTYSNMLIVELSSPDDYKTANMMKCTVHLQEIVFANVAETAVSARSASTAGESSGGAVPVEVPDNGPNNTALESILEGTGIK